MQSITCEYPDPQDVDNDCIDNWGLDRTEQYKPDPPLELEYESYHFRQIGLVVKVYVLDSGIMPDHQEFTDSSETGFRVEPGQDIACAEPPCGPVTADCIGHGTHVAAIIGGRTFGVAKNVTILPVRFSCDHNRALHATHFTDGLEWIAGHHLASDPTTAVINISGGNDPDWILNGLPLFQELRDMVVDAASRDNLLIVQSAGNYGDEPQDDPDACNCSFGDESKFDPEDQLAISRILVVGGSDENDERYRYVLGDNVSGSDIQSNYGPCVDIWAPAAHIASAWGDVSGAQTDSVCRLSGTSMAAAHVSGIAAMILEAVPGLKVDGLRHAILRLSERDSLDLPIENSPNLLAHWDADVIFLDGFEDGDHQVWSSAP